MQYMYVFYNWFRIECDEDTLLLRLDYDEVVKIMIHTRIVMT